MKTENPKKIKHQPGPRGRGAILWMLALPLLALTLQLSGCSQEITLAKTTSPPLPAPQISIAPSSTQTATIFSSLTPTPSASSTPSPTPTPVNPMVISAMRQTAYPGSSITLEETLEPGSNYARYYASYLSEGYKIFGLLTVPNGEAPPGGYPAIVFNHGYIPPTVYRTTERYLAYVDQLASHEYVVFRIDYRGHDRSEGEARGAYGNPGYTADVLNAVGSLKQYPLVNPEKIGMWGHSMGGYLTLRAMVISPDIRVGVIWAGVVANYPDMLAKWRRTPPPGPTQTPDPIRSSWRQEWVSLYGSPEENPDFWSSISANSYLGDLSGPLQLHHATGDEEVPYEFSQTLAEQIKAAGGSVELYLYDGDNHNLSGSFSLAMQRTIYFYDTYLKAD